MANALRCSDCGISWPFDQTLYATCPECLSKTDGVSNETPLSQDEALSRKSHADFERWLDENGRRDDAEQLDRIPVAGA